MVTYDSNFVKSVKDSCSQHRAKFVDSVLMYVDKPMTMREIATELNVSYHCVRDIMLLLPNYRERVFNERSRGREGTQYATGDKRSDYKGHKTTHVGYSCFKSPVWYTGKKATGACVPYAFEHILIMCAELQIDNLGKWHVHHIDCNKKNNSLSNLTLMLQSDHLKLHANLRKGVTTIPLRKYVQVNGSAKLWSCNEPDEDIVYSNQRWLAVA